MDNFVVRNLFVHTWGVGKKALELGIRQATPVLSNPDRKSNDSDDFIKMKEVRKETVLELSLYMNNN